MTSYILNSAPTLLTIKAFKASSDIESSKTFVRSHLRELKKIGVTKLDSAMPNWIYRDDVYVIAVIDQKSRKMLAGAKIELGSYTHQLPIEKALSKLDQNFESYFKRHVAEGICEMTGLWISETLRKENFTPVITRCCLAILPQLGVNKALVLSSQYTINSCKRAGYRIMTKFGKNGKFKYPTPEFTTYVACLDDLRNFSTACQEEKILTRELAINPKLFRFENNKFLIDYRLKLTELAVEKIS